MSEPFVVGIVGNLSGRVSDPAAVGFLDIDCDDFDRVLGRVAPSADLGLPRAPELRLRSWHDFHPDGIAAGLPFLARLVAARDSVGDPTRMRALLVAAGSETDLGGGPAPPPKPAPTVPEAGADLLAEILATDRRVHPAPTNDPALHWLIEQIADASADRTDYARQEGWRAAIDAELTAWVRRVLHHDAFQRLEATWASIHQLVRDCDSSCRVRLLDRSPTALIAELDAAGDLESTELYRLVHENERGTPGGEPFDLLIVDHCFSDTTDDLRLLEHLGELAAATRARLLAGAKESLVGHGSSRLATVRESAWAGWVGLCLPRTLLRLPYGTQTEPAQTFVFEECGDDRAAPYLWGNSAFTLARIVTRAVARETYPQLEPMVEDLPFHVFRAGEDTLYCGPTELLLTDTEIGSLAAQGFIPFAGVRGRDTGVFPVVTSLAGGALFGGQAKE